MFGREPTANVDAAIGVLPVETILAEEHDLLHGDTVSATILDTDPCFDRKQIIDAAGLAHAMVDAWSCLQREDSDKKGQRSTQPAPTVTPLDLVAMFVLGGCVEKCPTPLQQALLECTAARASHGRTGEGAQAIQAADEVLAELLVDRFNHLLGDSPDGGKPIEDERCFRPFLEAGVVNALGMPGKQTNVLARRLLLEGAFTTQVVKMRDRRLAVLFEKVRERETAALCLSGGGIRSATFALGVLRGLAKNRLLGRFDYLSTVSGGGYIGSWLSAWMLRDGASSVHEQLGAVPDEPPQVPKPPKQSAKLQPEPEPVRHLRAYSHYLTPRIGLLSADTWTLVATVVRNMFLNWLVFVPLLAAGVLIPRFFVAVLRIDYDELAWGSAAKNLVLGGSLLLGVVLATLSVAFVHQHRDGEEPVVTKGREPRPSQRSFLVRCLAPLVASSMLLSTVWYLWWSWTGEALRGQVSLFGFSIQGSVGPSAAVAPSNSVGAVVDMIRHHSWAAAGFVAAGVLTHILGWLLARRSWPARRREAIPIVITGLMAGVAALWVAVWFITRTGTNREVLYVTFAPPAMLALILVGSQIFTGWTSRSATDSEREWSARFNAWLLIAIVGWCAFSAIVLYGPTLVHLAWQKLTLLVVGGGSGLATLLLGRGPRAADGGSEASSAAAASLGGTLRRVGLALAAPVFAVSIVIALAAMNERAISIGCDLPWSVDCHDVEPKTQAFARNAPLRVISAWHTKTVDSLAHSLGPTGADAAVARIFNGVDSTAREIVGRGLPSGETNQQVKAVLGAAVPAIDKAVQAAKNADLSLMRDSRTLTAAALASDSTSLVGVRGDSALRADFARRTASVDIADRSVSERVNHRDSVADRSATVLNDLDTLVARNPEALDDGEIYTAIGRMRDAAYLRSRSAFAVELMVRADSVARVQSHALVDSVLQIDHQRVPADAAVPGAVLLIFVVLAFFGLLMGRQIDTNKFALHGMYHARLVRAYLGASRPACDRNPNPFTGFDPTDDVPMGTLWPVGGAVGEHPSINGRSANSPPLHVVNLTLNLVAGGNLAWQQRKAESFSVSPLHAGSAFVGYRPSSRRDGDTSSKLYGGEDGITLGTAVTISGAAASPNSGSHSTPLLTFLMTVFNARLGSWLGNPGRAGKKTFANAAPTQSVQPIFAEMFGMTSDQSPYVYLSDGGHFENLALYEMVLRRCRFILVSDAGCDQPCNFEDLGNAVRKIRVDLGVPIEFSGALNIYARDKVPKDAECKTYYAAGRIKYSAVDMPGTSTPDDYDGILLYVKPAIYGDEPRDVYNYSQVSETFPHESTTDQFFSESQFESYRALGEYIIDHLVTNGPLPSILKGKRDGSMLSMYPDLAAARPVVKATEAQYPVTGGPRVEPVR